MSAGSDLWFLNTRVTVRVSTTDGNDGISVLEHHAPAGDSPPLHLHRNEDEIFHVLEGRLRVRMGESDATAGPGDTVVVPKGARHTYRVESREGARWLTIMRGSDFESFVRNLGRPAAGAGLPEPSGPPTPEQIQALGAAAAQHGIELVGPPLQ